MSRPLPVIWAPRAERDLIAIRSYIAADSPMAAERFAHRLRKAGERLSDFPEAGRVAGMGRVLATVTPYLISYRIRPEGVIILSVRHGRRRV